VLDVKHWWRQVEAGMCSAMQHTISIRTLKHRAKLLDPRGVHWTSIGVFESSARDQAAYDGVRATERAHNTAKAIENVADLLATGRLQKLATCIDKLDNTLRIERQQYEQSMRHVRDNYLKRIKNILVAGATDERVAATTAVDEHTAAMADSTSSLEALRAAREHFTAQRANTGGMLIARENEDVRTLLDRVKESNIATSAHTQQACAPVDTTHMTLGNSGLGARAGDERVVAMECEIMSEREDGEQSMIAGGGTGQYTSEANKDMTQEQDHTRCRCALGTFERCARGLECTQHSVHSKS